MYSAPNESWSFSFDVPDPLDANPTSMVTNASYLLDGAPISRTITSVEFYTPDVHGLFNLNFGYVGYVALYGPQIINLPPLTFVPGMYTATINYNLQDRLTATGTGMVDVGQAVSEPSSIVSGGLGFLTVVGLALRRGIRRNIAALNLSHPDPVSSTDSQPGPGMLPGAFSSALNRRCGTWRMRNAVIHPAISVANQEQGIVTNQARLARSVV